MAIGGRLGLRPRSSRYEANIELLRVVGLSSCVRPCVCICSCAPYLPLIRNSFSSSFHRRSQTSSCGSLVADGVTSRGDVVVKPGYRLVIVDKDGVLVSEFQLTERALAMPEAFVEGIKATIDSIEEEES